MHLRSSRPAVILFLLLALFQLNCKKNRKGSYRPDDAYKEYISAFTSGIISNRSSVRILLASETTASIEPGKESEKKLFSFSPEIRGKTIWVDKRTVEFVPEAPLASGQLYEAEFYLSKVASVPNDMEVFSFRFQV